MTTALPIEAVAPPTDVYRLPLAGQPPMAGHAAQFAAALGQAQSAQADSYVRGAAGPVSMGDGTLDHIGALGTSMSHGFRTSIDQAFSKLSNIDFTEPSAMVTMLEVHLGVFGASTQVQFASKVADFSVHGLTTLFRNQG